MRKILLLLATLFCVPTASAQFCDRDCLTNTVTSYLDAMLKHDPSLLPVTGDVRFTEDNIDMDLGDGLWEGIEGLGTYRQDVIDTRTGTAGTHVVAYENGNAVLVAIRLKVVDQLISEVETMVVRNAEEGMLYDVDNVVSANPEMNYTPSARQRNTRDEMIELALLYPEGIRVGSFVEADAQFAPDAYRFENGQLMAGTECTFMPGCENIREQSLPTLAGMQAQVAAVDEEQGIVWLRMNFGPGSLMRGEGELDVFELFKIYNGHITAVEAFMETVPPGTPFSWEY